MIASVGRHRRFGSIFLSSLLTTLLVLEPLMAAAAPAPTVGPAPTVDRNVRQVLNRLTFGVRPGDFEMVKKLGVRAFIEQQLSPDSIDNAAVEKKLEKLPTLMLSNPTLAEQYNPPKPKPTPMPIPAAADAKTAVAGVNAEKQASDVVRPAETKMTADTQPANATTPADPSKPSPTPAAKPTPTPKSPYMVVTELQRAKLLRAVYSERQLYEVMVDFWENHFSIFANKDADRLLLTSFDRDAVRPFAMGRFRELLGATAHSPAMLFYLDNWNSSILRKYPATKDKPERQTGGINENYARELMELHTMGVDGGYTQKDVQEVARCFTGWTIRKPNEEGIAFYNPAMHDNGPKEVLGVKIPAGGGIGDGERVLDILASHPSTAKFIATKLARRFLGDNPPPSAVNRASKVFLRSGGSITETLRSIITGPEFFSPQYFQTKVRSPFEFVAAALRATAAETDATRPILDWISRMGQPVYGRITPDGYPDRGDHWLSNNDLLARFNFAAALATNKINGTKLDPKKLVDRSVADDPQQLAAALVRLLLLDHVSPSTKAKLETIVAEKAKKKTAGEAPVMPVAMTGTMPLPAEPVAVKPAASKESIDDVRELIALVLGTPEFQKK